MLSVCGTSEWAWLIVFGWCPEGFGLIFIHVEFPCQNKEVVAEPVDVGQGGRSNRCVLLGQIEHAPFSASADGAADVAAARQPPGNTKLLSGGSRDEMLSICCSISCRSLLLMLHAGWGQRGEGSVAK